MSSPSPYQVASAVISLDKPSGNVLRDRRTLDTELEPRMVRMRVGSTQDNIDMQV
jgi:hypothetical protein